MNNKNNFTLVKTLSLAISLTVAGCVSTSKTDNPVKQLSLPAAWSNADVLDSSTLDPRKSMQWHTLLNDEALQQLIILAKQKNHLLQSSQAVVDIAKQTAEIAGVTKFPDITLSQGNSRRKVVNDDNINYQTTADVNLQLSYELDLWGKLSDQQHQASLDYLSAKNNYFQQEQQLIADVSKAWFSAVEAQQLLALYQARAKNQEDSLAMIESSYRLGLKDALDVYLAKNNLNSELARVTQQEQTVVERKRTLELLIGQYPNGQISINQQLPDTEPFLPNALPAQLLTKRADLVAAWYQLLALDAGVAVAHKQRFPRIALTSTLGDSSNELGDLLDGGALAWSLIGNITMPIFNAGKLAAQEQQAKLRLAQQEQLYLKQVYQAFSDVENGLNNHSALKQRYLYLKQAQENANQAEQLSFAQYQKGLVSYTTVLDAQRRLFDAQTAVIQVKNQLIQNQIALYLALGGGYQFEQPNNQDHRLTSFSLGSQ
ncbi:efflux transporter outer membrane subunit [Thalassotalea sp. G2M2-11]|uniref:efflux transporter outer membrane subunit n=1 Tax=Thalassotalea sp. G2M2-11 TaxID=2787627 RepID=UPI0019D2BE93|nr:efflux transporter outer membrane subunit [Thalassotalea sp. G2M2-11]